MGLLCDGAKRVNIMTLLGSLPGQDDGFKVKAWMETIREFVALYADLARGFAQAMQSSRLDDEIHDLNQEDDITMEEDGDGMWKAGVRARLSAPAVFDENDSRGSGKGVELAEKVLRILSKLVPRVAS